MFVPKTVLIAPHPTKGLQLRAHHPTPTDNSWAGWLEKEIPFSYLKVHDQGRLISCQGRHCLNKYRLARPAPA
jgi:hypothetical protein